MNRKLATSLLAAPLLLGGVVVAGAAPASQAERDEVVQLTATITDFTAIPDRPADAQQQPGDQLLYNAELSLNGKPVGQAPHHCTAVTATYSLCQAAATLPDGEITFQTALGGANQLPSVKVAITGGTGRYRDAHGQLTITANADGSQTWLLDLR